MKNKINVLRGVKNYSHLGLKISQRLIKISSILVIRQMKRKLVHLKSLVEKLFYPSEEFSKFMQGFSRANHYIGPESNNR